MAKECIVVNTTNEFCLGIEELHNLEITSLEHIIPPAHAWTHIEMHVHVNARMCTRAQIHANTHAAGSVLLIAKVTKICATYQYKFVL